MGGRAEQLDLPVHAEERQPRRPAAWATRLAEAMKQQPALTDVDTDQQDNGVETFVESTGQRRAPGHQLARRRQRALQRLRPAPGGDHLRRAQPVPRDHGAWRRATRSSPKALRGRLRAGRATPATGAGDRRPATRRASHAATPPRPARRRTASRQPGAARPVHRQRAEQHRDAAWCRCRPSRSFAERATPTSVNHQDAELATTDLVQPAPKAQTLADGAGGGAPGRGRHRHADQRARQLPGHGARRRSSRRSSSRC